MQVFRLVSGGFPDRMIAFRSLPDSVLKNVRTRSIDGMPRYWGKWLIENECVRDVFKTETEVLMDRRLHITKTPIAKEPCFYVLDYVDLNADKEKWQEICNFLRRTVDKTVRLMDKIEDMAKKMAPDCHAQLDLEPEDILVIEIPVEAQERDVPRGTKEPTEEYMTATGDNVQGEKKRGRPKKVAVEA